MRARALALLGLVGALHRNPGGGPPKYREGSRGRFSRDLRGRSRGPQAAGFYAPITRVHSTSPRASQGPQGRQVPPQPAVAERVLQEGRRQPVPKEVEPIWSGIREELRRETPDLKFHIWLAPLEPAGLEGRTLYVRAPEHIRGCVGERYLPLLRRAAVGQLGDGAVVEIVGADWRPPEPAPAQPAEPAAASTDPPPPPRAEPPPPPPNPAVTPNSPFDQFVTGEGNRLAHAASLAAAELPAQAYNPLFLHGPPGLGKTHLLHAIGNYVSRYGDGLTVRYATVETFTSEFVGAVRSEGVAGFKARFRGADVLLIDDIQFLASKQKTEEEFFHTFNALYETGRQLVCTSDRPPAELAGLEARLRERFECGLVIPVESPSPYARETILRKRLLQDRIEMADEAVEELAANVDSSVRALEGALIRVVAYASLRGEQITAETVRGVLGRLPQPSSLPARAASLEAIQNAAAEAYGLSRERLLARDRSPQVAL